MASMRGSLGVLATGAMLLALCEPSRAADNPRTTYGEIGILDMPSARMAPDGELSATLSMMNSSQRYNFDFQLLPWLEGSFRYSRLAHTRGLDALYDRSFGLKVRLARESEYYPEISIGIRDLLGTGVYGAEYIVASKRVQDFDITAGLGWGRLAGVDTFDNPFGLIFSSFKTRQTFSGNGGTVNFGQFFHGPSMGLFGGVVWHSPIENLNLLLEYSSDKYLEETAGGAFKVRMPINIGASYSLADSATLSAGWFYGSSYGVTLNIHADPTVPVSQQRLGPEIPRPVIRPDKEQADALTLLLARSRPRAETDPREPFVQLPNREPDTLALASAVMNAGTGVRDVDVVGHTLLIDAHLTQMASTQCDRYAALASAALPRLQTIAMSDSENSSGQVTLCSVAHHGQRLAADSPGAAPAGRPDPILDPMAVSQKIRDDVAAQSLQVEALAVEPEMAWVYFSNRHFASEAEAAGRIARILMADAPPSVEIFHIVSVRNNVELLDFQIARSALERATLAYGTPIEMGGAVSLHSAPLSNPILERAWADRFPHFQWNIGPGLREGFFDPHRPLQVQVMLGLNASVELTPNLSIEGRGEINIFNTYDVDQDPNSLLPHVRTDIGKYFRHGDNGVANLFTRYRTRLSRDIYFEARAGYLEDMFAGAGAQVLWRPEGSRFAFGADLYEVWQRNFDRLYGVQNYHVLTGHVSAYYESPWYGLNFAVHAGQYLAGDYGATFEMTRRFSTGVEIGAFATLTNVPFAKFGEGSFDKGIIIRIPLEWALPFYSQSTNDLLIRSLTRDGGQRLDNDDSLYVETRASSYGENLRHIDEVTAP